MVLMFIILLYCNYYEITIRKNINSSWIKTGQLNALSKSNFIIGEGDNEEL
jgi:hypothetical protein